MPKVSMEKKSVNVDDRESLVAFIRQEASLLECKGFSLNLIDLAAQSSGSSFGFGAPQGIEILLPDYSDHSSSSDVEDCLDENLSFESEDELSTESGEVRDENEAGNSNSEEEKSSFMSRLETTCVKKAEKNPPNRKRKW
eukprot:CAMPEP_0167747896 /NCGR_PEP_ID=MMETSP0110_2-20121227/4538_1 /TAXON_ID=629695 /ORGANISM="Gymnochlora sp., Strain CCMP2014" /LENGTH=139 /DNA_ID=CAMNT_0007632853 /DNA_START=79 /DNA_END=495 /DNA_ORIENTATION=+